MTLTVAPTENIAQLWATFKSDSTNQQLRNQLIEIYLPLVKYTAQRVWSRLPDGVILDDLTSAGVFGLIGAIDSFDPARGVKFETYCSPRVRGAILDELRKMDWVPRLVRSKANKLGAAHRILAGRLGRTPADDELAGHMGVSLGELEKISRDANAVGLVSLNRRWHESEGSRESSEMDVVADRKSEDPTHRTQKNDLMRLVTKGLNRNERLIVILYYYEEMTMKEIGSTLELSESRVSQMHSAIMRRLQGQLGNHVRELAA